MLSEPGNELKVFLIMSKSQTMENAPVQTFIISNQFMLGKPRETRQWVICYDQGL